MIFVSKRGPKCSAIVCPVFTVAPQPDINIIDATDDGVLLQCEVRGAAPKPRVEWQDRDGNKLPAKDPQVSERGDRYHITLQTTVTKTLSCSCVVTQEETNRRTHAEIYVAIIGDIDSDGASSSSVSLPPDSLWNHVCSTKQARPQSDRGTRQ
ncbi:uncharacterized protein LOC144517360 isoform X2 [Sander vitreus]